MFPGFKLSNTILFDIRAYALLVEGQVEYLGFLLH